MNILRFHTNVINVETDFLSEITRSLIRRSIFFREKIMSESDITHLSERKEQIETSFFLKRVRLALVYRAHREIKPWCRQFFFLFFLFFSCSIFSVISFKQLVMKLFADLNSLIISLMQQFYLLIDRRYSELDRTDLLFEKIAKEFSNKRRFFDLVQT